MIANGIKLPIAENSRKHSTHVPALDGLRGLLALIVAVVHALDTADLRWIDGLAQTAVQIFFVLSGCVLTRAWAGNYSLFLLRRIARLWPVHLLGLLLCLVLLGQFPTVKDLTLFPWFVSQAPHDWHMLNPPTWSMCVEVAAMPFMPLIVFAGRQKLVGGFLGCATVVALGYFCYPPLLNLCWFIFGASLSCINFKFSLFEGAWMQWLGKISYSLYLSHGPLMTFATIWLGPFGPLVTFPIYLLFGWLVWRFVERPSIVLSRKLGRQ